MGQKIHPYGFRVGVTRPWMSRWYANKKDFGDLVVEDFRIRKHIMTNYKESAIPRVAIERKGGDDKVTVFIHTAKAGTLLDKRTNRLTELEKELSAIAGGKQVDTRLIDVSKPELDATLCAQRIAEQIERRIAFRRAGKREMELVQQAGALGIKLALAGRLGGRELARTEKMTWGSVPLTTLSADVDYGFAEAHTSYGLIGCKVWIFRGKIQTAAEQAEAPPQREGARTWR